MPSYRTVVTLHHPTLGGIGTNTWHLRTTSDLFNENLEGVALMGHLENFYTEALGVFASETLIRWDGSFTGIMTSEGTSATAPGWEVGPAAGGGALPPANAIVVNWVGQTGDRSKRGRTFLGPIGGDSLDADGTVAAAQLTAVRDAAQGLVTESEGFANGAFGVFSRQESLLRDFVISNVTDQFAVLRSRRD